MPFVQLRLTPANVLAIRVPVNGLAPAIDAIEQEINQLSAELSHNENLNVQDEDLRVGALWMGASAVLTTMFTLGVSRSLSSLDTWFPLDGSDYSFKKDLARQSINALSTTAGAVLGNLLYTGAIEPLFRAFKEPHLQPILPERLTPTRFLAAGNQAAVAARDQLRGEIKLAQRSIVNPSIIPIPYSFGEHFHNRYKGANDLVMAAALCIDASIQAYASSSTPIRLAVATGMAGLGALSAGIVTSSQAANTRVLVPADNLFPHQQYARTPLFEASGGAQTTPFLPETCRTSGVLFICVLVHCSRCVQYCRYAFFFLMLRVTIKGHVGKAESTAFLGLWLKA